LSKVALDIGVDKFYNYLRAFGFYDKTGIELPGEAQGNFHAKPTDIDLAVASFGQRFKVTPLEMIAAMGRLPTEESLIKPHLVKEIVDSEGNVVEKFEPQVVRNVISKENLPNPSGCFGRSGI